MDIHERAKKFEDILRKRFPILLQIGADLTYIAYILAYTESEKNKDTDLIQKRKDLKSQKVWKDWKKIQKIVKSYPEDFQKKFLLEFAGQAFRIGLEKKRDKMRHLERVGKKPPKWIEIDKVKLPKKPSEWYLDRAILDLGSYFEAISSPCVKQLEKRRQYQLIADLLYDFGLFKQELKADQDENEIVRERVIKRAEAILAKKWKEHIQGVKESLQKLPAKE